nr:DUF397 domain-containing protein [Streptomyces capitiformicae]
MSSPHAWQKSTFSGGDQSEACVELALATAAMRIGESDHPTTHLTTTPAPLQALLATLKAGPLGRR